MIVGARAIFPPQTDDHLVQLVWAQLLQRFGQKGVGLIWPIVDQAPATRASPLFGHTSCQEEGKLLVELAQQREGGGKLQHERQVLLILFTAVFFFTNDEILMVPDQSGLLFLAHTFSVLCLLLSL